MLRLAAVLLLISLSMLTAKGQGLEPVFSDALDKDTRPTYEVEDDVKWHPGTLTLAPGSSITRVIDGGAWAKVELGIDLPKLSKEQPRAEINVWFMLKGATNCHLRLEERVSGKNGSVNVVTLVDTGPLDVLHSVRQRELDDHDLTQLTIEYRYGLVTVTSADDEIIFTSFIENRNATVAAIQIQATSIVSLTKFAAMATRQAAKTLSDGEKQRLNNANHANSRMLGLYRSGDFTQAAKTGEVVVENLKATFGTQHPDYATSLYNLATMYSAAGDHSRALPLCKQALEIQDASVGERHPDHARSRDLLSTLYQKLGDYRLAERNFNRSLESRRITFGERHPEYGASVNNLANLYLEMGDYERAEPLLKSLLGIAESVVGNRHPSYATALGNLARLHQQMGDFNQAERRFQQAIEIERAAVGDKHPMYATSLNNLAALYKSIGDYTNAERLFRQALEIDKSVLGSNHPDYAICLNNLAGLYVLQGDYAQAEPLYKESLAIARSGVSNQRQVFAASLNNLGRLYEMMGDSDRAEPHYKESIATWKSIVGDGHPSYATGINNLAHLYAAAGEFSRAEPLFLKALEIRGTSLGANHPDYAGSLNSLALLYHRMEDYERAMPLYKKALETIEATLGKGHLLYAQTLQNLAGLHLSRGDHKQAQFHYDEALKIQTLVLGENHPSVADTLIELAALYDRTGRSGHAMSMCRRAVDVIQQHLDENSLLQSERQQKRNQAEFRHFLDWYLSIALRSDATASEVLERVWQWKGAVTFRQQAYRRVASNPKLDSGFESLRSVSRQLSALSDRIPLSPTSMSLESREIYRRSRQRWEQKFSSLRQQREDLEQQIAMKSSEFRLLHEPLEVSAIQKLLPPRTAFVDFLEHEFAIRSPQQMGETQYERRYIAFVVRADRDPVMIGIGNVDTLSAAITTFRKPFEKGQPTSVVAHAAGAQIRSLLWHPVERQLDGIETVVISPDTELGTLPFAALPGKTPNSFLIEDYAVASLPMARLLPGLSRKHRGLSAARLLVVGDVDYSAERSLKTDRANRQPLAVGLANDKTAVPRSRNARQWDSLPGFRAELESIKSLHQQRFGADASILTLTGATATENALLDSAKHVQAMHVITHGYFEAPDLRSIDQVSVHKKERRTDPFIDTWMPGLLTGLVLAGANHLSEDPSIGRDGILRASEIESAVMNDVDLVVLSACETGLGAVAGGEGLSGLQRAFHIAGARSVIASLWKVDDRATEELMRRFYSNLWLEDLSKIESLREAQLWMLNHPSELAAMGVVDPATRGVVRAPRDPGARADSTNRTSPFFWAAFGLSGDWN